MTLTGIAVTALVAICSLPVLIVVLAPFVLGERLTGQTLVALVLGIAGTALLIGGSHAGTAAGSRLVAGGLLTLAAGLAYALYVLVAKAGLARTRPLLLTAITFAAAAVVMLPTLVWTEASLAQVRQGWPWLLYLGGVATAGAYALYAVGLRRVPASVAGIVTLLEPLTAALLGVLVFGERLERGGVVGTIILLTAMDALLGGRSAPTRS